MLVWEDLLEAVAAQLFGQGVGVWEELLEAVDLPLQLLDSSSSAS